MLFFVANLKGSCLPSSFFKLRGSLPFGPHSSLIHEILIIIIIIIEEKESPLTPLLLLLTKILLPYP